MARKTRLHIPGGIYHVILKGNGGQTLFFNAEDCCRLLLLLQEGTARFDFHVHGFCLMDDHVHLLLEIGNIPLSKLMQNLAFRYTRWVNRRQQRTGHLFQGRYRAILIDQEKYLLDLVRYIHLIPVRAKQVRDPTAYAWSGHRSYLGWETLPWLTTQRVLQGFAADADEARQRYARFVLAGVDLPPEPHFHQGGRSDTRILGNEGFVHDILTAKAPSIRQPPALDTVVQEICRAYGLSEVQLSSRQAGRLAAQARALTGLVAMQTGAESLTAVSMRFNRDVATLSTGIRRLTAKIQAQGGHDNPWGGVLERFDVRM